MNSKIEYIFSKFNEIYPGKCKLDIATSNDNSKYYIIYTPRQTYYNVQNYDSYIKIFKKLSECKTIIDDLKYRYSKCFHNDYYSLYRFNGLFSILDFSYSAHQTCSQKEDIIGGIIVLNIKTDEESFKTLYRDKNGLYFKSKGSPKQYLEKFNRMLAICNQKYYEVK